MYYLYAVIFVLLCYSLVSSFFALKFALIILKTEDELQESVKELEASYLVFDEILKKPVFFDSIEIRQCISEIVKMRQKIYTMIENLSSVESNILKLNKNKQQEQLGDEG
jgi:hypothetical protein